MATDALLMQMDADADAACCCIGVLIMMESGDGFTSGNLNGLPGAKRPLARVGKLAASSDCLSLLRPKHKEHKESWIPNPARLLWPNTGLHRIKGALFGWSRLDHSSLSG